MGDEESAQTGFAHNKKWGANNRGVYSRAPKGSGKKSKRERGCNEPQREVQSTILERGKNNNEKNGESWGGKNWL